MLARTEEKKETDDATVASGTEEGIWGRIGLHNSCSDEGHQNWFDALRRGVLRGIALKLIFQAELDLPIHHHLLANGTNVVLHQARSDRVTAGGELATAEMFSEDLRERDGIREINEVGVANV
jgi:hypothetical protein